MYPRWKRFCFLVVLAMPLHWLGSSAPAQEPSVEDVLNQFVESLGGAMHIESMSQYLMTGSMQGGGRELNYEFRFSEGKYAAKVFDADHVHSRVGFDGQHSWQDTGGRLRKQDHSFAYDSTVDTFGPLALVKHLNGMKEDLQIDGEAMVDDRATWKMVCPAPEGINLFRFFDKATGRLLKTEISAGDQKTENYFDYDDDAEAGEVNMTGCRSVVTNSIGQRFTRFEIKYESIDRDAKIDESIFEIPEDQRP